MENIIIGKGIWGYLYRMEIPMGYLQEVMDILYANDFVCSLLPLSFSSQGYHSCLIK
jgi:hypothetical protein